MHLLYLEDNPIDQKIFLRLARQLESVSFDLADTIGKAKDLMVNNQYDLILTDYYLQNQEATELFGPASDTPIVILSGAGEDFLRQKELPPCFAGIFSKPLSLDLLAQILQSEAIQEMPHARQLPDLTNIRLDFSFLKKVQTDGEEEILELLTLFVENGKNSQQQIQHASRQKDWKNLHQEVHKLKSSLRIFGLIQLFQLAEEIETHSLLLNKKDRLQELVNHFCKGLQNSLQAAENLLEEKTN